MASGSGGVAYPNRAVDHFASAPTTPSRVFETVYQNTSSTARLVTVAYRSATSTPKNYELRSGPSNPPTEYVWGSTLSTTTGETNTYVAIVKPGEYYTMALIGTGTIAGTLFSWQEVDL